MGRLHTTPKATSASDINAATEPQTDIATGEADNSVTFSFPVPEDDARSAVYFGGNLYLFGQGAWTSGGTATVQFPAPPTGPDIEGRDIFVKVWTF